MERATTGPAARNRHALEMRPDMMTDSEINAELKTASGERLAALQAEREDRRVYRASMRLASRPTDSEQRLPRAASCRGIATGTTRAR
jgi:hypothetical protein